MMRAVVVLPAFLCCAAGCGPPAGHDDATDATHLSSEGETTAPYVEPPSWVNDVYSNVRLTPQNAVQTNLDSVTHFEFRSDGAFLGRLGGSPTEERRWSASAQQTVYVMPSKEDPVGVLGWEVEQRVGDDECPYIVFIAQHESGVENEAAFGYRGRLCVVDNGPCPPDEDLKGHPCTYNHLEWCDDVPSGCDAEGCDCSAASE